MIDDDIIKDEGLAAEPDEPVDELEALAKDPLLDEDLESTEDMAEAEDEELDEDKYEDEDE